MRNTCCRTSTLVEKNDKFIAVLFVQKCLVILFRPAKKNIYIFPIVNKQVDKGDQQRSAIPQRVTYTYIFTISLEHALWNLSPQVAGQEEKEEQCIEINWKTPASATITTSWTTKICTSSSSSSSRYTLDRSSNLHAYIGCVCVHESWKPSKFTSSKLLAMS